MKRVLVIGAGFAGAVYAHTLASAGYSVVVIDKRTHIAGNCFDEIAPCGVRFHRYGPHLFHTSNMRVVKWLSQFTDWMPYKHKVKALLPDGRLVPMPVNLDTVAAVYNVPLETATDAETLLSTKTTPSANPANAEEFLYAKIGPELTNLFYRPYSWKMWQQDLKDTSSDVVARLKIRTDSEDHYFPTDTFQALPTLGYTELFARIFDHPLIEIRLETEYSDALADDFDSCFNSMPIDEYFAFDLGPLPYRSIRFHHARVASDKAAEHVVINYTDDRPYTRETWWHLMPGHHMTKTGEVLRTIEEPCDYNDNASERFYPVKTSDGRYDGLYRQYADRTARHADMTFIGRCGTYQYLDMDQVINQSMMGAEKWLKDQGA
jgi:UDP-galactopyranose mutase